VVRVAGSSAWGSPADDEPVGCGGDRTRSRLGVGRLRLIGEQQVEPRPCGRDADRAGDDHAGLAALGFVVETVQLGPGAVLVALTAFLLRDRVAHHVSQHAAGDDRRAANPQRAVAQGVAPAIVGWRDLVDCGEGLGGRRRGGLLRVHDGREGRSVLPPGRLVRRGGGDPTAIDLFATPDQHDHLLQAVCDDRLGGVTDHLAVQLHLHVSWNIAEDQLAGWPRGCGRGRMGGLGAVPVYVGFSTAHVVVGGMHFDESIEAFHRPVSLIQLLVAATLIEQGIRVRDEHV